MVGAGPVGLTLALLLSRAGRGVLVLEKKSDTSEHSRAPAIWPRTQEVLAGLKVLDRFLEDGIKLDHVELWDADRDRPLLGIPLYEMEGETEYAQLLILPQARTEQLLLEAAHAEPTIEILFAAEVTWLEQDRQEVRVTFEQGGNSEVIPAPFVVGCDGAHSIVREIMGASFEGITYPLRVALADITLVPDHELAFPRLTTESGLAVGIRISRKLWRLILPFSDTDSLSLDERVEASVSGIFPDSSDFEIVWQSEFRLHRRLSSSFVRGRICLAGDAAHLNSPVGGQGMNAGIQDAEELARHLLLALSRNDPARLNKYDRNRREAIRAGVNPFTHGLTRVLFFRRGRLLRPLLRLVSFALRIPPLRRRFLRRLAMLNR